VTNGTATAHSAAESAAAAVSASVQSTGHEVSLGVTLFFGEPLDNGAFALQTGKQVAERVRAHWDVKIKF
jgi:hypothetical protein